MENFITWVTTHWMDVLQALAYIVGGASIITGFVNGPGADKANTVFERILGLLRNVGITTYKNEPGTLSLPFKSDTGERVTQ